MADAAIRAAHAAHCAAAALSQRPVHRDTARFLDRRVEVLLRLADTLAGASRCESRLHQMDSSQILAGMIEAEDDLLATVRSLLSKGGLKLEIIKLLEEECLLGQASKAHLRLAEMADAPAAK